MACVFSVFFLQLQPFHMIKQKIKAIKDVRAVPCVSLFVPTHRTAPDMEKDPIALKTLIADAERRLQNEFSKSVANALVPRLNELAAQHNFNHSLDGLALFVSESIAERIVLPVPVEPRVIIDGTFATRDIYRAMHSQQAYFILTLQGDAAQLYDAFGDRISMEVRNELFPFLNDLPAPLEEHKSEATREDNRVREFVNRVDKRIQTFLTEQAGRLVVVATGRLQAFLQEVTDNKNVFIGFTDPPGTDSVHDVAKRAWAVVEEWQASERERAVDELRDAVNDNRFASDLNDIWRAINEGRGDMLIVEEGYFQPAAFQDGHISLEEPEDAAGRIDDVVDEIIELCMEKGGSVVFVENGELPTFDRIGLITRY